MTMNMPSNTISVTWCGHATWLFEVDGHRILLDPFLDNNPSAKTRASDVECDSILITHGHFDHIADASSIAKRTGARVYAIHEISVWLEGQGVANVHGMNLGGRTPTPFGSIKMLPAMHSSQLPDGSYGGVAAGFLLNLGEFSVYCAGDTSLFSEMKRFGEANIDLAILPIGDNYTMGPEDSLVAIQWLRPRYVMPSHFNTWPPIAQDPQAWAKSILQLKLAIPLTPPVDDAVIFDENGGTIN